MKVLGIVLSLTLIYIIIVSSQEEESDELVIFEKIDRAGSVQDGGEEDLGKFISKSVNDELENDEGLSYIPYKLS